MSKPALYPTASGMERTTNIINSWIFSAASKPHFIEFLWFQYSRTPHIKQFLLIFLQNTAHGPLYISYFGEDALWSGPFFLFQTKFQNGRFLSTLYDIRVFWRWASYAKAGQQMKIWLTDRQTDGQMGNGEVITMCQSAYASKTITKSST